MEHFYDAPHMGENWFTYPALYKAMVERFPTDSHFIEVGSWKGKSAAYMAVEIINSGKTIRFDCIDIWSDKPYLGHGQDVLGDEFYNVFLNNIQPVAHIINPIRKDSVEASLDYADKSLDFVFIDADHSYEGVKRDIISWLPKMKNGSILAGHDYGWSPDVRRAVKDVFGEGSFADPWGAGCFIVEVSW